MKHFDLVENTSVNQNIETLESFFALADSGKLFTQTDIAFLQKMRKELVKVFKRLLVWERPQLEEARGILWPYRELRERYPIFLKMAETGPNEFMRGQAQLFLAFLPFPNQWSRLLRIEDEFPEQSEIQDFLLAEQRKIEDKVRDKPQSHFKLRHFCQVLKSYKSPVEKGILRIFSLPYLFIRREFLSRLTRRYVLYMEPPMGVVFRHEWWRYFSTLEDPCIFGACSEEDALFLENQFNVETVPLAHGDFLEDIPWEDHRTEKQYDIVFNATFDDLPRKRHELMLELLQHPFLRHTRALFLGRGEKENVERFRENIRRAGLENRVNVLANLKRTDIPEQLALCKMGVHLSLYESACRSIYEFFRSGLPCVISSSMAGMNSTLFNSQTGMSVPDKELPQAVAGVLDRREMFKPRDWFLTCSGSLNSTRKLNEFFKDFFERRRYEWTEDIVLLGSSGASRYVYEKDYEGFRAEFEWLLKCFREEGKWPVTFSAE